MNTISLNNLWSYLQGLSLTASNQRWLAEKLIEKSSTKIMTSAEDTKLNKLNALFGVWSGSDGEHIEEVVQNARKTDYERKLISMD
jgi:hypothetical protein